MVFRTLAGAPAAIVLGARSRVTTELAPITQRSPTLTPLVTTQLTPNQQLAPISTGPLVVKPCQVTGARGRRSGARRRRRSSRWRTSCGRRSSTSRLGGDHRVAVEEAAVADLDPRLGRQRQPAAGLEQGPFADPQPALVERLEHLALDRMADEEAAAGGVAVDPPAGAASRWLRSYQRRFAHQIRQPRSLVTRLAFQSSRE